jgi:hypothetical protein
VLSSASIAGILTGFITLGGIWFIENHKTNLILQQERIQNTEKNYENLEALLDEFSAQLGDLTTTANLALKSLKDKQLHDSTLASLKEVAGSMANVVRASERHGIDAQVSTHLRETLGPLALELNKAQSSFGNVRSICELYKKDLKSELDSLEAEIQKKISELSV